MYALARQAGAIGGKIAGAGGGGFLLLFVEPDRQRRRPPGPGICCTSPSISITPVRRSFSPTPPPWKAAG
jgi:hypothetical protein